MQQEVLFEEDQRFRQWWIWLILLGTDSVFLYWVCKQLLLKTQAGDNPMDDVTLIISTGVIILITVLFFLTRLSTQIRTDGIYIKFFPFHWSYKYYSREMIAKSYVRTYSPLGEYGGWGLRYSISGHGMAYNVSGNKGLQLELNNGKKILIGTSKPIELEKALLKLNNSNS